MKKFKWGILFVFLISSFVGNGQVVLYSEDFNSYSDGTTSGFGNPPMWTLENYQYATNYSPNHYYAIENQRMKIQNLGVTEASAIRYIRLKDLDITGYDNIIARVTLPPSEGVMETSDQVYFKITSPGSITGQLQGYLNGSIDEETVMSASIRNNNASTLEVRISFINSGADEIYYADDIEVIGYTDYPIMWLRADGNLTVRSDDGINWWPDEVLGSGMSTTDNANTGPNFTENAFNFNPAARFDGNDRAYRSISNSLLNPTNNTCFIVQRFESGKVVLAMGQNDVANDRRLNFVSDGGNPRFDFPNHSSSDGRLVGTTSMVNTPRIYTLTSTASQNKIHYNGNLHASKNRTSTLPIGQGNWSFYLGSNINSGNYSTTQIAEVIYFNHELEGDALDSWYSYLGLKYGFTIKNNGSDFIYLASDHSEIWDGSTTYQNDVAGIAADALWELYQNVSSSINTSASTSANVTMATDNDFTSPNEDYDRTKLNDGQYLIWGHNNGTYNSFTNSGDYNRINRFWKVQNTGAVGDVHFQINLSGFPSAGNYHVVVDNDTDLSNGVLGEHELTLSSGSLYSGTVNFPSGTSYFTIAESLLPPTGFWVKADADITLESGSNEVEIWGDQSGTNNATMYATWDKPYLQENISNFNPAIRFYGSNDQMNLNRPVQDDFTFAVVVKPNSNGPSGSQWWQGDGIFDGEVAGSGGIDLGGLSIINNKLAFGTSEPDHTVISSNPIYANGIPHIAIATRSSSSGAKALYIDGMTDNTGTGGTGPRTQPSGFRIGSLYTNNNYYDGHIFEIMSLPSIVSTTERQRIESYFALKYGLEINKNYTASPGVVYNVSSHNNDIAGIGKDDTYGLDQKISSSTNTSSSTAGNIIVATINDFTSNNLNVYRKSVNAGSFLVWGHNNGGMTSWQTSGSFKHVPRKWKIQETGSLGSVHFQINLNNFPSPTGHYFLILDNESDFSDGVSNTYQLTNSSGSLYSAEIDFPSGTNYFSIGYSVEPQIAFWVKADRETSSGVDNQAISIWYDQSDAENDLNQTSSSNRATFQENELNFNPTVLFDGSNDFYSLESTSGLGYGASARTTFVVANENGTTDDHWSFVFSYGSPSSSQGWCVGKRNVSTKEIVFAGYGNNLFASNWGDDYRLITSQYNGSTMKLFAEGSSIGTKNTTLNTTSSLARVGKQINNSNEYWGGEIAEVLHYVGDMSETLRKQIESYLSIKYGMSLPYNYLAGSNTIYTVSGYGNHIAGIAKDTTYDLDQRISSSIEIGSGTSSNVTVSTNNNFTANNLVNSRSSLSNGQYLIWGHNNGNTSSWTTSGDYKHVARKWKIQNTGNVDSVYLQINLSGYPTPPVSHYLIVDNDNNISNGVSNIFPLSANGNNYTTKAIFGSGTNYFTIGYYNADIDYGDAPNSYSTLIANSGPSHIIVSGTYLGSGVSNDTNGFRDGTDDNSDASDDTNDDGVSFNPSLGISSTQIVQAGGSNTVRINASVAGYISAWVDFNIDGDFDDSGEQIANNTSVNSGDNDITFTLGNANKHGKTYARFRFYTTSGEGAGNSGVANSGEVEDYQVHIASLRPSDICSNLIVNGGFEEPNTASYYIYTNSNIEGWNSSLNKIEVWESNSIDNIASQEGDQLSELNSGSTNTYYQDVITVPGETMSWQVYHRGRSGTNQAKLKLGAPGSTSDIQTFSTGTSWTQYTGSYTVPSGQHITRFEIVTVSPTGGSANLLDNIRFSVSDNTNPVITANQQNVVANNTGCTYLISGTGLDATATDNCSVTSLTHNYDGGGSSLNGKSFPVGTTDVTWTATDPDGNSTNQIMQVIVTTDLSVSLSGPANDSACSGVDAVFTATASGGLANYTYSFYVNDIQVTTGVSNNTYTNSGLSNGDVVKAKAVDSNSCEVFSTAITITIHSAPAPVLYHE